MTILNNVGLADSINNYEIISNGAINSQKIVLSKTIVGIIVGIVTL